MRIRQKAKSRQHRLKYLISGHALSLMASGTVLAGEPLLTPPQSPDVSKSRTLAEGNLKYFDVQPGPLQSALSLFAEVSRVELFYRAELAEGRRTQGVQGQYSVEQALAVLLAGTEVAYRFTDTNTVTLYLENSERTVGAAAAIAVTETTTAGSTSESEIPVVSVKPIEVTDTIKRSKVFLPPVDGYKADETTGSTRTALPITETPSSIGVVTRDLIKDTFSRTKNDAFEHVSGVSRGRSTFTRSESFNIRGFNLGGVGAFSVFRSNGLPAFGIFSPDPALIERYEVIKGPVSIVGGASSPGGFVNRITKTPQDANFATSEFQAGSYGLYRGVVDANGVLPSTPNVRGRLIFAVEEGGHFVDDVDVRQYTVAPSIEIDLFDGAGALLFTGHYQKFDGSSYPGLPLLDNGNVPDIPRTRNFGGGSKNGANTAFEEQNYELHYNHEFFNNLSLSIKGKYSYADLLDKSLYGYNFGRGIALDGTSYVYAGLDDESFETYAGEIFVKQEWEALGQQHEILVGVDHREHNRDFSFGYVFLGTDNIFNPGNVFDLPPDDLLEAGVTNSRTFALKQTGLFGQAVIRPFESLTLVGAGRYDWAKGRNKNELTGDLAKETYSEFTGRFGANYELLPEMHVYGGFSQSFEVNVLSSTVGGSLPPPATGESYEVGAKFDLLDGRLLLTTALFRSYRQNVSVPDPVNPNFSITVGEQRHQGVEFDVNGRPWPGLNLTANVSFINAEITKDSRAGFKGNSPSLIPRSYVGRVFATYELQTGTFQGLGFGGGVFFQSGFELEIPNRFSTKSYERVDAIVFYRSPQKVYDFTINVRNLLDATYIEGPGRLSAYKQFGAPVSVFGTLRVKFDQDLDWSLW
ncbi:MAG: ligand-gated channel [Nitrospirales bacterium]|nr:MAG: ligand-gated channel [Nitrospirales bacterium]